MSKTNSGTRRQHSEEVYLKDYGAVPVARENLGDYFAFYNNERRHESLGYKTPAEIRFKAD